MKLKRGDENRHEKTAKQQVSSLASPQSFNNRHLFNSNHQITIILHSTFVTNITPQAHTIPYHTTAILSIANPFIYTKRKTNPLCALQNLYQISNKLILLLENMSQEQPFRNENQQEIEQLPLISQHLDTSTTTGTGAPTTGQSEITIGEALEAAAQTAGYKLVDHSDAAAIQAAEARATGGNVIAPGGLAALAQSAATFNAGVDRDDGKIRLNSILTGATGKLSSDKAVRRQDAEGVLRAELRNTPKLTTYPGGVAASVTAAARLNEDVNAVRENE